MASVPSNNAFGADSPSWNLSFPVGNITAVEILTYLPHWLKSVDVIDRFVSHGGRATTIAAILNQFRRFLEIIKPNSVMVMMSYSMRRAGNYGWVLTQHHLFPQDFVRAEEDVSVTGFRTPRITHPKSLKTSSSEDLATNREFPPVEFKSLARHVKVHPSGDDALDLSRCVQYAVEHPDEVWMFPTDFPRLVAHLGGPATVTLAHHDRQAFARRNHIHFYVPVAPRKPASAQLPALQSAQLPEEDSTEHDVNEDDNNSDITAISSSDSMDTGNKRRSGRLVGKNTNFAEDPELDLQDNDSFASTSAAPSKKRKLSHARRSTDTAADDEDFIAGETEADDDVADEDYADSKDSLTSTGAGRGRKAAQKARVGIKSAFLPDRAPNELPSTRSTRARSSVQPGLSVVAEQLFPYEPFGHHAPQGLTGSPASYGAPTSHGYQASFGSQGSFAPTALYTQPAPYAPTAPYAQHPLYAPDPFYVSTGLFGMGGPSATHTAHTSYGSTSNGPRTSYGSPPSGSPPPYGPYDNYGPRAPIGPPMPLFGTAFPGGMFNKDTPVYLKPPQLDPNRVIINDWNVKDFSKRECITIRDMYASAFDFDRFLGPSQFPPYRELHRLSDPDPRDVGDFAENVRWAKQQRTAFLSVWTEEPDHLAQITMHRLFTGWVSKEASALRLH